MATKSKFFRVAVAGATVDGRTIEPKQIVEMAETFNVETYGPRVNCEHIRGFSPQPPFNCYGDVVALEARDVELTIDGKVEKRKALYAAIEPTKELVAITNASQKVFTSIEIRDNFAGTTKTGLVGLACTDNPASIGTERLKFNAIATGNTYSAPIETVIEYEPDPAAELSAEGKGLFAAVTAALNIFSNKQAPAEPAKPAETPAPANDNDAKFAAIAAGMTAFAAAVEKSTGAIAGDVAKLAAQVGTLEKTIENTDNNKNFSRKPATGGDGRVQADF